MKSDETRKAIEDTRKKERRNVAMIISNQVNIQAVNSELVTNMRKLATKLADWYYGIEKDTPERKHFFKLCGIDEKD